MISSYRFVALLCCISAFFGPGCDRGPGPRPHHPTLLVSFDGFRYDYLRRVDTPHFDSMKAAGVSAEGLIPVFPTNTFPNHYSMATGLYPENSGLIDNTMYDPVWEEWYRIGDRASVEDGKWYEGEPIWNTLEKQGLRTGTMFWVGSEADIQGRRPTYWKPYRGEMPGPARIDTVVKWLSYPDSRAVDFATLYFGHVDRYGHDYGLQSDSLDAAIARADRLVGYLKRQLRAAGLWDRIRIVIVSDHGMVELSADKIIEVDRLIDMDHIERVTWGAATMLQPKAGRTGEVYRNLRAGRGPYRVYRREELPERFHLKNNRRLPDIFLLADPGYTFLTGDKKARFLEALPGASHGYDNAEKAMQGLFVAHGPAFKKGVTVPPFCNIHLYELLNFLAGTTPAPNDGTLDSVRVLLN